MTSHIALTIERLRRISVLPGAELACNDAIALLQELGREEWVALALAIKSLNCETVVCDLKRDLKAAATLRQLLARLGAVGEK
jgi:hypothetical protein